MEFPGNIEDIAGLVWKRRFWILLPLILGGLSALLAIRLIPPKYRASTMILVESQKIPTDYVRPTVTTTLGERLRTIEQQITNRANLERIINELGLYQEELAEYGSEKTLRLARKDLELTVSGASVFRIFFTSESAAKAADTANRVAELFIQENLKRRADEARNTSSFLSEELESVKQTLEEQEEVVSQFRLSYAGRLPSDRESNHQAIDQLQSRLEIVLDSIDRSELRRLVLEDQLEDLRETHPAAEEQAENDRLQEAREELLKLRSQYTERHPDVIRLSREIERLEREEPAQKEPVSSRRPAENRKLSALQAELDSLNLELDRLRADQERVVSDLRRYQANLESIPRVEQQLLQMTRDYDNLQASYQSLLAKRMEARLAENLERSRQSEQFTILEKAIPPTQAFWPDRRLLLLMGLGLGGAIGFLLALWREQMDQSFREEAELHKAFPNVAVLGVVHRIDLPKQSPIEALEEHKTA
ncbi:MAG: Wzz/FepE/Etk N-terminal domain-containing protein [Thermoanaerobaculia bacterium]